MTADEAKDAHDRIWAVRERIKIICLAILNYTNDPNSHIIKLICGKGGILNLKRVTLKYLETTTEVNQFLKELG